MSEMFNGPSGLLPQILNLNGPKSPYERWREAEAMFESRDYYGAANALVELLEDPEAASHGRQIRELLARSYFSSSQNNKAVEAARVALESDPDNGYLAMLLSRSLERVGEKDEAAAWKKMALALGAEG